MSAPLKNKIDFAVIIKVEKGANPNGNPLDGNRPRVDYQNIGEISDVAIKRKVRNRLLDMGEKIFVQSDDRRAPGDPHKNLRQRAESVLGTEMDDMDATALKACKEWLDVRSFGQVLPFKAKGKKTAKKKGKEEDAGDESSKSNTGISIPVRGPVSVQCAYSVVPIEVTATSHSKSTSLEGDGTKREPDQFGIVKARLEKPAVYRLYGSMNAQVAERTTFSDQDAGKIKEALRTLFRNDVSSARPEGSMSVEKLIWWPHKEKHGQYSSAKVHRSLTVKADGSYTLDRLPGLDVEEIDGE